MTLFKILLSVLFISILFMAYMAWFKDWGSKSYRIWEKQFPSSIFVEKGEAFLIKYYRISVSLALICCAGLLVFIFFFAKQ
jgi:hypothetical protein